MEYSYKKSKDENHFYRIGENILHISHFKEDATLIQEDKFLTTETQVIKDDCCINVISGIREDVIDSSKQEFEDKLKEVIFILGIYEYCK